MRPHKLTLLLCLLFLFIQIDALGQRKAPSGGRIAVIVDERLAALRSTPQLNGKLVRRLGRGRLVAIRSVKTGADGVTFLFVNVTSRTRGWIQRESVVSVGDDERLLRLIQNSRGFDRISRSRIFLDHFRRSALRPQVLLLLGDSAEELASQLTTSITRKLADTPFEAPEFAYYLNHSSLDRYNRQGVRFIFNPATKRLHYDGSAWRTLLRHHAKSPEATPARNRLLALAKLSP